MFVFGWVIAAFGIVVMFVCVVGFNDTFKKPRNTDSGKRYDKSE